MLHAAFADLDGFYTFVAGTASGFGVLRDPVASNPRRCQRQDYVAFGIGVPRLDQAAGDRSGTDFRTLTAARLFLGACGVNSIPMREVNVRAMVDLSVTPLRDMRELLHGLGTDTNRTARRISMPRT